MKASDVAKYILKNSSKRLSNLELQKTLYFAEVDFIREHKKSLIDDNFEAWQFGPVVRDVYMEYRDYGANSIDVPDNQERLDLSDAEKETIAKTIKQCNNKSYWDLVGETHREGGAWDKTYQKGQKKIIDKELIRKEAK